MSEIERLIPKARGTGRLNDPPARAPLIAERVRIPPPGESGGAGVASPLTEQAYTGSTYYQLVSSDGLFVFEFADQTAYVDGAGNELVVIHRDPAA